MKKIEDKLSLVNNIWQEICEDDGKIHWFANFKTGHTMVETLTLVGLFRAIVGGQNKLLTKVLEKDIEKYGGTPEDYDKLEKVKDKL